MSTGSPTPTNQITGPKMTRAAVANLNRQKSEEQRKTLPSNGHIPTSTPSTLPAKSTKPSPHKSLPPQPKHSTKELPDVPEFYIVRPAPSTSNAKVERNDRRVFINRGTMEKINVYQGSVVLIQRHDPMKWAGPTLDNAEFDEEEDDSHYPEDDEGDVDQTTVGIAWPMDRIEPNGFQSINSKLIDSCQNGFLVETICCTPTWGSRRVVALSFTYR